MAVLREGDIEHGARAELYHIQRLRESKQSNEESRVSSWSVVEPSPCSSGFECSQAVAHDDYVLNDKFEFKWKSHPLWSAASQFDGGTAGRLAWRQDQRRVGI